MPKITATLTDTAIAAELFKRLEARRKALSLRQAEMAERIAVTPKTYRNIKSGACSLLVLLSALRELNLLENLDTLIPEQQTRPAAVFKGSRKAPKKHPQPSDSNAATPAGIGELLRNRKPLKLKGEPHGG